MTKTLQILTCALALLAAIPAAGFTQPAGATASARAADPARGTAAAHALGDENPALTAKRLLVATGVSEREPVGAASAFRIGESTHLYVFVELSNPDSVETEVTVAWFDGAGEQLGRSFVLPVGPHARFRTWARVAAPRKSGSFSVVVGDGLGNELGRADFTMTE